MKLAVIPARGGSKRIPQKNIRDFCGKPIISYSIEVALASDLFDRVIVSTDNDEIASIARKYGAETPFMRPAEIADDHTGTNAVVKHAIQWYQERSKPISLACCIYSTAPFIQKKYLREGHEKLINSGKSFAFSVTSFESPIQRAIRINENNEINAFWPENINTRSQDLVESYYDAGQFYWGRPQAFLDDTIMYGPVSIPIILPRHLVQDIDNMDDWIFAEYLYEVMQRKKMEGSDLVEL